ncbi:MAG: tyrosine-protein phosphatase [Aristaeellaceae bacterium]
MKLYHRGFTDLHQHVLWGMDDGPGTARQMHAMLEMAVGDGIARIAATSHAYPGTWPFDLALYRSRLGEANAYCAQRGWPLRLIEGCEIHYCDSVPDLLMDGKLPTLGGSNYALIEFDEDVELRQIGLATDRLSRAGFRPVIAHVERCRSLIRSPKRAMELREDHGLIYQMNCEAVLLPRDFRERRFVRRMLREQTIDIVATDAHDTRNRPLCMRAAYRELCKECGRSYAHRLFSMEGAPDGRR